MSRGERKWAQQVFRNPKAIAEPEVLEADLARRWEVANQWQQDILLEWYELLVVAGRIRPGAVAGPWAKKLRAAFWVIPDIYHYELPTGFLTRTHAALEDMLMPFLRCENPFDILPEVFRVVNLCVGLVPEGCLSYMLRHIAERLSVESVAFIDCEPLYNEIRAKAGLMLNITMGQMELDISNGLLDTLAEVLERRRREVRERVRATAAPFKENIMAAAFHPDRIGLLIERHGIDVLDAF